MSQLLYAASAVQSIFTLSVARYLLTDSPLTAEEPALNPPPDDPLLPVVCESLNPTVPLPLLPDSALNGPASTPAERLDPPVTETLDSVVLL